MAKKPPVPDKEATKAARKARKKQKIREILGRRIDRILARQTDATGAPPNERLLRRLVEKRGAL